MEDKSGARFDDTPNPTEPHVVNYLQLLGLFLKKFRTGHPIKGLRGSEKFAEHCISPYFNRSVIRRTIIRAENGDHKVSMGVISAFLHEMNVWPDLLKAISANKSEDIRYITLVTKQLRIKDKQRQIERMDALRNKHFTRIDDE